MPLLRPDGRRRGGHRQRRRPHAQRRCQRRRGGRGAGGPGPRRARSRLRAAARVCAAAPGELEPAAELPQVRRYDRRRGPRARRAWRRWHRRRSSTAAPRAWPAWPRSARCPSDEPILYAGDLVAARAAAPGRARCRGGGERLEPAAALRARVRPPEPRAPRCRATSRSTRTSRSSSPSPSAAATPRRWPRSRARATCAPPTSGGLLEFPEHARDRGLRRRSLDGLGRRPLLAAEQRWIEIGFERPRDVPYIELLPRARRARASRREVDVNGVRATIGPGRNRDPGRTLEDVDALRVTITERRPAAGRPARQRRLARDPRSRGCSVRQSLRPPVLAGRALAGRDLSRVGLTYLFERTTADDPFRRDRQTGSPLLELASNRADAEGQLDRVVFAPAARAYAVDAWVHPARRRARLRARPARRACAAGRSFDSSGRFHNRPRNRASSAFDGHGGHRLARHLGAALRRRIPGSRGAAGEPARAVAPAPSAPRRRAGAPAQRGAAELARRRQRGRCLWGPAARSRCRAPVRGAALPPDRARHAVPPGAARPAPRARGRAIGSSVTGPAPGGGAAGRAAATHAAAARGSRWAGARCRCARAARWPSSTPGAPLRARGCGGPVRMGAGVQRVALAARRRSASTFCACARRPRVRCGARRRRAGARPRHALGQRARSTACGWRSTGRRGSCWARAISEGWRGELRRARAGRPACRSTPTRTAGARRRTAAASRSPTGRRAACAAGYLISALVCLRAAGLPGWPAPARAAGAVLDAPTAAAAARAGPAAAAAAARRARGAGAHAPALPAVRRRAPRW